MSQSTRQFHAAYAAAFTSYACDGGEDALHMAYELGREAVELELNVLEIARLHHDVLGAALRKSLADDHERITHTWRSQTQAHSLLEETRRVEV